MTAMKGDVLNRVRRLPKPSRAAEALQPFFEAVSNAMHAVEDLFETAWIDRGRIHVVISNLREPHNLTATVTDNGIGLTDDRYGAFCTTDTDFKYERGGKGIGRLLWLDAFQEVSVTSTYWHEEKLFKRSFRFVLDEHDQIQDERTEQVSASSAQPGTVVRFKGLRHKDYQQHFPSKPATLVRHFGSHFLADFILGNAPSIELSVDDVRADFPAAVTDLLHEDRGATQLETDQFGTLLLASFICKKAASADFDGTHQLHYIAHGRTVLTRKIDGLLGIGRFGEDSDLVYHGCVSGEFLDERVNQERTHFNFDDSVAEDIAKACAKSARDTALSTEVTEFDTGRLSTMRDFLHEYPSFQFEEAEQLLQRTPRNAVKAEQFAQALIPTRIRRDYERRTRVQKIVETLSSGETIPDDFAEAVRVAAQDVRAEEQRQLTEYVLRRKIVLDVLEVLLRRARERPSGPEDYHLESTLHQFICPMRIRGDDPNAVESTDHDLWIIDERLAFAKYFASDLPLKQIIEQSQSDDRPDLFLFDRLHGLGMEGDEPLRRVILVEFKRPGRPDYSERYSPMNQISLYLNELVNGRVESFQREKVRIADDCVFYCYVVADIVGALDIHTSGWRTTANGRGRWTDLSGRYRGSIEVIEWRDLLKDARARNQAFIHAAGA